jgi:hypothetical protein
VLRVREKACGDGTDPTACEFCLWEKPLRYPDDSSIGGILGCTALFETHSLLRSRLCRKANSWMRFVVLAATSSIFVVNQWITCPVTREPTFVAPGKFVSREL